MAEPEHPPNNILANTFTYPNPPRKRPTEILAKFNSLSAVPEYTINSPASIKNGIAISVNVSIPVNIRRTIISVSIPDISRYTKELKSIEKERGIPKTIKNTKRQSINRSAMFTL